MVIRRDFAAEFMAAIERHAGHALHNVRDVQIAEDGTVTLTADAFPEYVPARIEWTYEDAPW